MEQIQRLKDLHYEFRSLIERNDWKRLNKRMREVRHNHDPNKSKTVLILTQNMVNNPHILEERYLLYQWFNEDMGWPQMEWPVFKNTDPNVPDKYKNTDRT